MPSPEVDGPSTITVTSIAFADGDPVPNRYTCDGDNVAPPLRWPGVPADAEALALVVGDPDAPRGTFTHWVVLDIPTDVTAVDEASAPAGGVEGQNSAGRSSHFGPCPPSGTLLPLHGIRAVVADRARGRSRPGRRASSGRRSGERVGTADRHLPAWTMMAARVSSACRRIMSLVARHTATSGRFGQPEPGEDLVLLGADLGALAEDAGGPGEGAHVQTSEFLAYRRPA